MASFLSAPIAAIKLSLGILNGFVGVAKGISHSIALEKFDREGTFCEAIKG